jgi:lipopolysaccharide/colanic/teichoic acid biosynthesis glycosyltransferase
MFEEKRFPRERFMSASALDDPLIEREPPSPELSDVFDHFVVDDAQSLPEWLTRLRLQRPRRSVRCLTWSTRFAKRLMDIVISSLLLLVLSPVMLLVAVAVWLTSPGPIIFRQERVGLNRRDKRRDRRSNQVGTPPDGGERRCRNRRQSSCYGKPFTLYKFRTMRVDAEKAGPQFAVKNDTRVTPIGRFLRRTRLDELPQLWNVLKGEMSLVGPRPERPVFIEQLSQEIPNYLDRLGLKPGLTGLAQVINGYDNNVESFKRKVTLDLLYLQNCCLWNDLKILIRTIGVVVSGQGAL